jgi:hypothetical protein
VLQPCIRRFVAPEDARDQLFELLGWVEQSKVASFWFFVSKIFEPFLCFRENTTLWPLLQFFTTILCAFILSTVSFLYIFLCSSFGLNGADGNGRTARLLMNLQLLRNHYAPLIIHGDKVTVSCALSLHALVYAVFCCYFDC